MAKGIFDDVLFERIQNPAKHLSVKIQYFCQFFAQHASGQQAAIEAGYSRKNAKVTADRILQNVYVKAYINELSATLFDKIGMSRAWLANRYKEVIDQDITKLYDEKGRLRQLADMPPEVTRTIARIKTQETYEDLGVGNIASGRTVEVWMYDKLKGMDAIRTMAGYNEEKSGVTINNSNVQMNFNNIQVVDVTLNL